MNPGTLTRLERVFTIVEGRPSVQGADQLLRTVNSEAPTLIAAYIRIGLVFRTLGRYRDAGFAILRALALSPGQAYAHYQLALLHAERGNFVGAERWSRHAISHEPGWADAHLLMARCQTQLFNDTEAAKSFARASALNPGWMDPYFYQASNSYDRDNFATARDQFIRVIFMKPDSHEAHLTLARALLRLGQDHEARLALECAESLNPQYRKQIEFLAYTMTPSRIKALLSG